MSLTLGSLFAGIGGIDLGFERAGFKTAWQVEIDPYCRAVLAKNFPDAERFEDVRKVGSNNLRRVDVIAGGFPCQDISNAGPKTGIRGGQRSGLWREYARIIGELRPRFVLVENVAALLVRGMDDVLGSLSALGYDAEWDVVPAAAMGAEHIRERIFILAYPVRSGLQGRCNNFADREDARILKPWLRPSERVEIQGLGKVGASRWCGNLHGIPRKMDRIRALGNSVVPQIPELIARRIIERMNSPDFEGN